MATIPLPTSSFQPPCYNIDILEGAVMHAMTFNGGAITDAALERFVLLYSAARGKRLKANYTKTKLLPRLIAEKKLFRLGANLYTVNPVWSGNRQAYDAFWVYLEFLSSVDVVASTMVGWPPAQISFLRNNAIYHIVCAEGNGQNELLKLMAHEMEMQQRMKKERYKPKEKVIIVFDSVESAYACNYSLLNMETMYCIISYPDGEVVPKLRFCRPAELRDAQGKGAAL